MNYCMCWISCGYFLIIFPFINQNIFYLMYETYEEAFNDITAASLCPAEWWRSLRVTPVTHRRPKHRAVRCWCGVSVGVRPWLTLTSHTSPALTTSSPASPHRRSPGISCLWVRTLFQNQLSHWILKLLKLLSQHNCVLVLNSDSPHILR